MNQSEILEMTQLKSFKQEKVLYVRNVDSSWTRSDFNILSKKFDTTDCHINNKATALKMALPWKLLTYNHIFCWFGSLNFFPLIIMSKLLNKKVYIVAGGFDVAKVNSINYGGFARSFWSRLSRKLIFKMADKVICVSKFNEKEAINNAGVNPEKITTIYHGFDKIEGEVPSFTERKNQIISIGAINPETMNRKGHKRFIELAKLLPEYQFILGGKYAPECKDYIDSLGIKNLKLTGFLANSELKNLFCESKYYVQLSEHEAFGCSVVEAGLNGCNLIISDKAALPEVVGEFATVFTPEKTQEIADFIKINLEQAPKASSEISSGLKSKFPYDNRESELLNVFK